MGGQRRAEDLLDTQSEKQNLTMCMESLHWSVLSTSLLTTQLIYIAYFTCRENVLYVSVSTVTKLAHSFSLRPYASMFIRNSQA